MVWTGAQSAILAQEKLKWDLIHMLDHSGQGRETLLMDTFDLLVQKEIQMPCVYMWREKGWWGPEVRFTTHQVSSHLARVCIHRILQPPPFHSSYLALIMLACHV